MKGSSWDHLNRFAFWFVSGGQGGRILPDSHGRLSSQVPWCKGPLESWETHHVVRQNTSICCVWGSYSSLQTKKLFDTWCDHQELFGMVADMSSLQNSSWSSRCQLSSWGLECRWRVTLWPSTGEDLKPSWRSPGIPLQSLQWRSLDGTLLNFKASTTWGYNKHGIHLSICVKVSSWTTYDVCGFLQTLRLAVEHFIQDNTVWPLSYIL